MFTREQYLDRVCTHRQYYGQFVTAHHKSMVRSAFTVTGLKAALSQDEHLNTIRLARWDILADCMVSDTVTNKALKDAGDYVTLAGRVCILKEAARQVAETE